ncbi:hypothetical protein VPNG_05852 [Cytospora leucostoma]|uniref:Uncharacterized protein n=1 Tax=Cytospora leucostoma TaxID=1230097 RepID=A0A423X0L2_9PEZI|nr:hypothetical protein VPNG_05852 [Cytospora leucostoma]
MDANKLPSQALWRARGQLPAYVDGDDDTSTIAESEHTFVNNAQRYALSHVGGDQGLYEDDEVVEIVGCGINHANADKLTFFGFASMRDRFYGNIPVFLLQDRRWASDGDSEFTIGKKNVIICFVAVATIEECLVSEDGKRMPPITEGYHGLMDALGLTQRKTPKRHTFLNAIIKGFTRSREEEINNCLRNQETPPVPEHPLDKMLLDVVDRHITFLRTRQPLTRLAAAFPREKALKLRCSQIKSFLADPSNINKCWASFVPTIPAEKQATWPWPWNVPSCSAEQAKLDEHSGHSASQLGLDQDQENLPSPAWTATVPILSRQLTLRPARHTHYVPQSSSTPTASNSPQGDSLAFNAALNSVETSFDELRSHIRPVNLSGLELEKAQQALSERLAHFTTRMKCVTTKTSAEDVATTFEDGEQLEPAALSTALSTACSNLDAGLTSIVTGAERGELSIQQTRETAEKVVGLFEETLFSMMNIKHICSSPVPISRSPIFTPGTPCAVPQGSEDPGLHKRRSRSPSSETVVAAGDRFAKRPRR